MRDPWAEALAVRASGVALMEWLHRLVRALPEPPRFYVLHIPISRWRALKRRCRKIAVPGGVDA